MKLEVGKRYVRRDGVVTNKICGASKTRWVTDDKYTWLADGGHYLENKAESTMDIVSEYIEPKPFPRYFVGNLWAPADAYLRFDSRHKSVCENPHETWREVTAEEAMARLIKPDEPKQPLRWVENCKPDRVGHWAYKLTEESSCNYVDVHSADQMQNASNGLQWCYLGPIPEILPPLKKVTKRLWLEARGGGLWEEHWCVNDSRKAHDQDWIRTDRTREREVQP